MYVERWLKAGVVQQDGSFKLSLSGTPQGGVISPLLANIFLHVVFDKWIRKNAVFEDQAVAPGKTSP